MDKSKIYLDLSKCSEEERKKISLSLKLPINNIKLFPYLTWNGRFSRFDQFQSNGTPKDLSKITYPDFIKLFEGGEGEKEIEHTCKYCGCLTTQSDDDCYANPKNTMETPKERAIELLSKINNQEITPEIWDNASKGAKEDLKRKVNITVNEIIFLLSEQHKNSWIDSDYYCDFRKKFDFWQEVKEELNKL